MLGWRACGSQSRGKGPAARCLISDIDSEFAEETFVECSTSTITKISLCKVGANAPTYAKPYMNRAISSYTMNHSYGELIKFSRAFIIHRYPLTTVETVCRVIGYMVALWENPEVG